MKYILVGLEKGECSEENLQKAKSMVPKSLEKYVERMYYFTYTYAHTHIHKNFNPFT